LFFFNHASEHLHALLLFVCLTAHSVLAARILSPQECEIVRSGSDFTIRWETDDLDDTVDIELWEGIDTFIETIASGTSNDGEFVWSVPFNYRIPAGSDCGPYIFIHSVSGYSSSYSLTGDDAAASDRFDLRNPISWGNANIYSPVNVADTLFKARWSGEVMSKYELQYREQGDSDPIDTIKIKSDRRQFEDLDDYVVSGLDPATPYEMRMRYYHNGDASEWTEWQQFTTYERMECTDEVLSAFFSKEVYDNIRTGDHKYPGFCGDWETSYAYISTSDFVAVYTEKGSGRVMVTWRGTESDNLEDAIDNLGYLYDCDNVFDIVDDECDLSSGFGSNYLASQQNVILDLIEDAIAAGFKTLISTGHSQGGALATVAALDYGLRWNNDIEIRLISFGAPEVGNDVFSDFVMNNVGNVLRFVQIDENNDPDEVSLLPSSVFGDIGGDSFLFSQLPDNTAEFLPCPTEFDCRINGPGPVPPFYCHCIEGYFNTLAVRGEVDTYVQPSQVSTILSSWLGLSSEEEKNSANTLLSMTSCMGVLFSLLAIF